MTEDYFWGLTLDSNKKKEVWDPDRNPASGGGDMQGFRGEHTLLVKQIVLGAEAKDGDVNVVEVEAMGYKADVKFPIAVMRGGSTQSQAVLDLLFPDPPVTFHLVKGSGPVHLLGNHTIGTGELVGDDDEDEDLEDELDEEDLEDLEESPERNNIEDKKRKLSQSNSNKKGKKTKVDEK
ncbi:nucleoplasmin-like protein [Halyomorpha halys]|uniref:nucleoplasmin-like protein n=1 Tax=Halyomorpha halys TaxID=286706 RepID=UPI0006D4EA18|nr:nucleoplasmin-like protein [Halyomorpha halys]